MFFFYIFCRHCFFCFATSENFHLLKLWKSFHNAFLYRKLCISCLISEMKNEKYDLHNFWSKTTLFIKKTYDLTNPILCFFLFSVVIVFVCFATSENFHLSKLWKSSDNAFMFRKLCILSLISDLKLHFLYLYNQKFC